jgi:hypothetical protein
MAVNRLVLRHRRVHDAGLAPRERLELPTYGLGNQRSFQLSYRGVTVRRDFLLPIRGCLSVSCDSGAWRPLRDSNP